MVTRDGSWLQPARDSSFGKKDFVGGYMGHDRNKGAHGGMSNHFVWIRHMTRSSSPSVGVLLLFPCSSLAFHTSFAILFWRPNRKGSQWMHPLEVSPLWTNPKKFPYPNLLTMVQHLKLNTGTVCADKAESDNASPSC